MDALQEKVRLICSGQGTLFVWKSDGLKWFVPSLWLRHSKAAGTVSTLILSLILQFGIKTHHSHLPSTAGSGHRDAKLSFSLHYPTSTHCYSSDRHTATTYSAVISRRPPLPTSEQFLLSTSPAHFKTVFSDSMLGCPTVTSCDLYPCHYH